MAKKEQNIQDLVYQILQYAKSKGLPYVTRTQIINECKQTSLKKYANEKYNPRERIDKLQRKVDQALYQLHKKGLIKKKGYGRWAVKAKNRTYIPRICTHLEKKNGKWYCPIIKKYIANPEDYCEGAWGVDKNLKKRFYPKCPFYTYKKSKLLKEYAKIKAK